MRGRDAKLMALLLVALGALSMGVGTAGATQSTVVGQWRFDESDGQRAVDDGPFGLDGRLGLTDEVDARDPERIAGLSGGALHFDGRGFVRLPAAPELEPGTMTLEAVVRGPSSPGRFRYVVSHGAQGCIAGSYGLYTAQDGGMAFYVFDGTDFYVTAAIGPGEIWNGAWHHVAGVFDGHSLRLLIDGHPVGDPIAAPQTIAYALTSSDHYIGSYQGSCALPLQGDVDLIRLWHGPLAPDFIGALADNALLSPVVVPPPPTPSPESVPVATVSDSQADAPASRTTFVPVAPGTSFAASNPPADGVAPKPVAGVPPRACSVRSSSSRVRAGRRSVLTVRVALRGKPLRGTRVIATQAISSRRLRTLGRATTARDGRAHLRLRPVRRSTIHLAVPSRTDCSGTKLTVLRARSR
ncbi:MAG TPA: LamG domain-containing protein [Baekduia sp.]|nr:LamG domain-containing protein [Baekduia sp.]